MQEIKTKSKWYALFVVTGDEDNVKERLQYKFENEKIKVLVPKRRLRERKSGKWEYKIRTLFPGYVLINGYLETEDYYLLKGIPGIIKLLKANHDILEIDEQEIKLLSKLISNNEVIDSSKVYVEGTKVIVIDGPLLGMEGCIQSIDKRKGRAKVMLGMMGQARLVDLSITVVQSA